MPRKILNEYKAIWLGFKVVNLERKFKLVNLECKKICMPVTITVHYLLE